MFGMTTEFVKHLVARGADSVSQARETPLVATIGDRLEEILKLRGWSQRQLGREAGIAEQHIGILIARFAKDPEAEIELSTLRAIARAARVDLSWLIEGRGAPEGDAPAPATTERYPNRAEAVRLVGDKADARAIESVVHWDLFSATDPKVGWWVERILELDREIKAADADPAGAAAREATAAREGARTLAAMGADQARETERVRKEAAAGKARGEKPPQEPPPNKKPGRR